MNSKFLAAVKHLQYFTKCIIFSCEGNIKIFFAFFFYFFAELKKQDETKHWLSTFDCGNRADSCQSTRYK